MDLKAVKILLQDFGDYVIQQSRSNLTKGNKEYSKKLYNSLDYEISPDAKGLVISFIMEEYGLFQDEGVKGKDPSKVSPNAKITGQQAPNSRFRFGSGNYRGSFEKFAQRMSLFAKSKNIRFRQGKTGKFAKGGYKSMGYVIAKNIYYRGLKPSLFFTKPFEKRFDRLPNDLVTAFVNDIEKNI
tara:strand:+ start:1761 stop:2312 length:552 start_codon:yes stop_codon:yes gene_type:complete